MSKYDEITNLLLSNMCYSTVKFKLYSQLCHKTNVYLNLITI